VAVGLENHFGGKGDGGRRLPACVRQFTDVGGKAAHTGRHRVGGRSLPVGIQIHPQEASTQQLTLSPAADSTRAAAPATSAGSPW